MSSAQLLMRQPPRSERATSAFGALVRPDLNGFPNRENRLAAVHDEGGNRLHRFHALGRGQPVDVLERSAEIANRSLEQSHKGKLHAPQHVIYQPEFIFVHLSLSFGSPFILHHAGL